MTAEKHSLGRNDLLASYYTLSGAPNGLAARHSFDERLRAAATAGYAAIGLTVFDVDASTSDGRTVEDLARVAGDHGVRIAEIETLRFSPQLTEEEHADARRTFRLAGRLGARHVNVFIGRPPGTEIDMSAAAASFAELCQMAGEAGLLVAFEFMPFMAVSTVDAAARIVELAGSDNGGLVVDSYHFFRGGSRLADLARLPGHRIITLQLSDAPAEAPVELLQETRTARLLPGEGGLPLEAFLHAVDLTGTDAPVGVEILSDALRPLSAEKTAVQTAEATRTVLRRSRT